MTMPVVTVDFETHYSRADGYSLSAMSTEDYVADDRFEIIGVGAWIDDKPFGWFSGTHGQTVDWLRKLDLPNKVVCGHHLMFDGLILAARCDIVPAFYACTESMCRPFLKPILKSLSLGNVSKHLGLGEKGQEVVQADGKRRADFEPEELREYLEGYCLGLNRDGDCRLTRHIYNWARPQLNSDEMLLIDQTMRMYLCPMFKANALHYDNLLREVQDRKAKRRAEMELQGITADVLRSKDKFAALLRSLGIEPPMKVSPAWLKKPEAERDPDKRMTYAFSKADPEYIALREEYAEHPDISLILDARIHEMSSIEERRTEAMLEVAKKYPRLRIDLSYYRAHTGRFSASEQDARRG